MFESTEKITFVSLYFHGNTKSNKIKWNFKVTEIVSYYVVTQFTVSKLHSYRVSKIIY